MSPGASKRKTGLISKLLWLINIFCAFSLLAAYLASYVNPEITTFFAFLGLAYPIFFLLNLAFFLFWLIRGRSFLFLSMIVILIGYNPLISHVQLFPGRETPQDTAVFKVLSYNVQNMANSNAGIEKSGIRREIVSFIDSQFADITCIQEFSARGRGFTEVFEEMKELTHYPFCYYENYYPNKTYRIDALVILSRFPILHSGILSIPGDIHTLGIYTDLLNGTDTFRLYNLHLESIRFRNEDYQFVEDVTKGQAEKKDLEEGSKSILRKLHNAYLIRSKQTGVVEASLAECPYPVIICGDFNDTPLSYAYHKISSGLEDAFINSGHGFGNTFTGKLPPLRIDFILYSPDFQSYDFRIPGIRLSDHFPVTVFIEKRLSD